MDLHSEYITKHILGCALELSSEIYNCCIRSCMCFTGKYENDTTCPICKEPHYDQHKKAQNWFCYIPIILWLQAMFKDPKLIDLLLHQVQCESDPNLFEDVLDCSVIQQLLASHVKINGKKHAYRYGEFETNIFLALTCDRVSVHKGVGAHQLKTMIIYCIFPHFPMNLWLPPVSPSTPLHIYDTSDTNPMTYNNNPTSCSHCPACTDVHAPTFRLLKNDPCTHNRCPWAWPICLLQLYYLTGTVHPATH